MDMISHDLLVDTQTIEAVDAWGDGFAPTHLPKPTLVMRRGKHRGTASQPPNEQKTPTASHRKQRQQHNN